MGGFIERGMMRPQRTTSDLRVYQITIAGKLDRKWSDWFGSMAVSVAKAPDGSAVTTLSGVVADQATLRGILNKIWDLNLTLVSVIPVQDIER
jgi:hypothetical protein